MSIGTGHGGFLFNDASIRASAPASSGVYALYDNAGNYVYFGESNDIQRRLLEHLNEPGTCIKRQGAANFAFELSPTILRVQRQNSLIRMYPTLCNQRLG